jgi:hypothetical protein
MLHPKIIFLVNDWVYNSPIFGKAVQLAGFYPVSGGIANGVAQLKEKVAQGYSLMAFPEGTRSTTNKIRRFHKGAFFLAEKLKLDVIPVLIHGNSEVLPKGGFIIRDGSITVKILERILSEDMSYGKTDRERTKLIGTYFRKEFEAIRSEIENETYFHSLVKLDYRYKGDGLYRRVKKNLKENSHLYKTFLDTLNKRSSILNLTHGEGELDLLLLLDSADRKICTYIEDESTRSIVENSFITKHYNQITFASSWEEALNFYADAIIINASEAIEIERMKIENNNFLGFEIACQNHNLVIFKKTENT